VSLEALEQKLGVAIEHNLLELALTHRSYSYERGNNLNNERLEFLGDSILGFLVTAHIHKAFPLLAEGELTKLKNAVVSAPALAEAANEIGLGEFLLLGKGELMTGGRSKQNLLADSFEAILGAAFVSSGLDAAKKIVDEFIIPMLANSENLLESADPKTSLIELLQSMGKDLPEYEIEHEGPDHDRTFTARVLLAGQVLAKASGRSRKQAETNAAANALASLRER
jgi:ribonuclease III